MELNEFCCIEITAYGKGPQKKKSAGKDEFHLLLALLLFCSIVAWDLTGQNDYEIQDIHLLKKSKH